MSSSETGGIPPQLPPASLSNFFEKDYYIKPWSSELSTGQKVIATVMALGLFVVTGTISLWVGIYSLSGRAKPASNCASALQAQIGRVGTVADRSRRSLQQPFPRAADPAVHDAMHYEQKSQAAGAQPSQVDLMDFYTNGSLDYTKVPNPISSFSSKNEFIMFLGKLNLTSDFVYSLSYDENIIALPISKENVVDFEKRLSAKGVPARIIQQIIVEYRRFYI